MKKNIILMVSVCTLSIALAFTTASGPEDVWIKVKVNASPNAPTICINTGTSCDSYGDVSCTIVVPVSFGTDTTSTGSAFETYKGSNCTIRLSNTEDQVKHSKFLGIYRLVNTNED